MKSVKLRLAINLNESSTGYESLFHELAALSEEKRRHRILSILMDYSRGISESQQTPQTHQMNVLTLPDLDLPKEDKPVSPPMSNRDAMREAMQLTGFFNE